MKKKKKNNLIPLFSLCFLAILIVFLFIFNYRLIKEREGNEELIIQLQAELLEIQDKKTTLEKNLEESDDVEYIERVLREEFLMQKPGEEKVVILLPEEEQEAEIIEEKTSFFQKIKSIFYRK